jgi:hypothetical protein
MDAEEQRRRGRWVDGIDYPLGCLAYEAAHHCFEVGPRDQTYDICDVYGVAREGGGWMLKIYIDETVPGTELTIISFHPLRHPLRTNGGFVKP